jgi:hypothetical protein
MPAKAAWLLKIPEIIQMLEAFDVPVVDRAIIERLFGLRRRQAIELLHRPGGYQAGKTFLVDRHVLIENLRRLAAGEEFDREIRRKERLDGAIDRLRQYQTAARVRIPISADVFSRKLADLPTGVAIVPGHLHIAFSGRKTCWPSCSNSPRQPATITTGSARRRNRSSIEPRDGFSGCGVDSRGRTLARPKQGGVEHRVEFRQGLDAELSGIELQCFGEARDLG